MEPDGDPLGKADGGDRAPRDIGRLEHDELAATAVGGGEEPEQPPFALTRALGLGDEEPLTAATRNSSRREISARIGVSTSSDRHESVAHPGDPEDGIVPLDRPDS